MTRQRTAIFDMEFGVHVVDVVVNVDAGGAVGVGVDVVGSRVEVVVGGVGGVGVDAVGGHVVSSPRSRLQARLFHSSSSLNSLVEVVGGGGGGGGVGGVRVALYASILFFLAEVSKMMKCVIQLVKPGSMSFSL